MNKRAAIVGAGPAGLIAAEVLSGQGWGVSVYDQMPSAGRKFLMAGRGGLNLTHSENFAAFVQRYGESAEWVRPLLNAFGPMDLIAWAHGLGQETFTGSSGRVFPKAMKASPLLRAWLTRLTAQGVAFRMRHRWLGWDSQGKLSFDGPDGVVADAPDATLLALGGGSWPKLGSDGSWTEILRGRGVEVTSFVASNCGVLTGWSDLFSKRFAGTPLNGIAVSVGEMQARGEATITRYGLEGGAIYAVSPALRAAQGGGELRIDLRPGMTLEVVADRLDQPRRGETVSNFLRKRLSLAPAGINLLREAGVDVSADGPRALAAAIKSVRIRFTGLAPIERAISTAGGLARAALDADLRIRGLDNVYSAGEMIDWDAPTGGYLLQMCFASGIHAARRMSGI
jgi:hypothetical protein